MDYLANTNPQPLADFKLLEKNGVSFTLIALTSGYSLSISLQLYIVVTDGSRFCPTYNTTFPTFLAIINEGPRSNTRRLDWMRRT